ncbi:hypothetical protein [Kineosporia babensis]|uniref:Uncharacterized protein n=1 Tax=Kineosporia babensis TaxID=499548 RepID=A0A9X1NKM6_9ACTN|nr:hypothetical protein [Kineosporia babensis]MCD5314853.1 hypothetical protein [Kineosporia babensis]
MPMAPTSAAAEAVPAETVISAEDYDRAKAKAASTPDTSAERRIEAQFLEDAAVDHGNTYTRAEVEVVDLGPAFIAGPVDLDVKEIVIAESGDDATVEVAADLNPGTIDAQAPSSGSAEYATVAGGSYRIVVKGVGDAIFTWEKAKRKDEKDKQKDYWAYAREANGEPYAVKNWPNPRVSNLYIRNYPTQSTYSKLRTWEANSQPAADFKGDCNESPMTISLGAGGAGVEMSFRDCASNDVSRNSSVPGEMRIEMDQGSFVLQAGNIGTGYIASFSTKQGEVPYFNDQQRVTFRKYAVPAAWGPGGPSQTCEHTNGNRTC